MHTQEIFKNITSLHWENRVQRPGFLQSKAIINEAETQKISITPKVSIKSKNIFWIKDSNLYDQKLMSRMPDFFIAAFKEDKDWPLKIIKSLAKATKEKNAFIKKMITTEWENESMEEKIAYFKKYVSLLIKIEKFYIIAVPLTDYCEYELNQIDKSFLTFATPLKSLDLDKMINSLSILKNKKNKEHLIADHLKEYAWIKTAYNIIDHYTKEDLLQEIKTFKTEGRGKRTDKKIQKLYLLKGLQTGIYLRNRMKELSQQLWYYVENLGISLARDLSISRNDFYQMTPKEVLKSLKLKKCVVSKKELEQRHRGFIHGFLSGKEIICSGQIVDQLSSFFTSRSTEHATMLNGNVACKGIYKGRVKIILSKSEFNKLNKGDILVTSMTTPDYVIIMKSAGAIVTDEGGLSCHAAIVSREFKIPCIIGTKVATKILKDNDFVEVDADNGRVKILNNK